jgi:hypothetical protein
MQSITNNRKIGKLWIYQNRFTGDYVAVDTFNRDIMSLFRNRNQTLEIAPDDLFIEGYLAIKRISINQVKRYSVTLVQLHEGTCLLRDASESFPRLSSATCGIRH